MGPVHKILTANRLRDGEVVYWASGRWVTDLADGEVFAQDEPAQEALKAAGRAVEDRIVVNPYLFEIRYVEGRVRPVEERELIRAAGPTIRRDVGKQARHVPV
ncbi:MAG TPA: DUF2849 domain-containing protein [Rhizomicrobium sp.]|nr:DUF2849 domain-containing protein [Rhizomicrobium sp.]